MGVYMMGNVWPAVCRMHCLSHVCFIGSVRCSGPWGRGEGFLSMLDELLS